MVKIDDVEVCFEEITPYDAGSIMFWAVINSKDRTELVFIENGTLNAHRYMTEILILLAWPALRPFLEKVSADSSTKHQGVKAYHRRGVGEHIPQEALWNIPESMLRRIGTSCDFGKRRPHSFNSYHFALHY